MTFDYYLFCINDDKPVWKGWKLRSQCTQDEIKQANLRSLLPNEIVLDIDKPDHKQIIVSKIESLGYKYKLWETGGKGYHLMLYSSELEKLAPEERKKRRKEIISLFDCDITKAQDKTLIGIEQKPHRKTGKIKTLLQERDGIEVPLQDEFSIPQELKEFVAYKPQSHSPKEGKSIIQINNYIGLKHSSNPLYKTYSNWEVIWHDIDFKLKNQVELPLYDCILEAPKILTRKILGLMEGRNFPITILLYIFNQRPYLKEIRKQEIIQYKTMTDEEIHDLFYDMLPDRIELAKKKGGNPKYSQLLDDLASGRIMHLCHSDRLQL